MVALSDSIPLTPEKYLELEEKNPTKHEYIDGQMYAMAGTTDTHNTIIGNLVILIIEVLSSSTEAFDRGDKFNDYQTLDSLEEYVLINSKYQRVETFRRNDSGLWVLQTYMCSEPTFTIQSIDLIATFADLYEDVQLEAIEQNPETIF